MHAARWAVGAESGILATMSEARVVEVLGDEIARCRLEIGDVSPWRLRLECSGGGYASEGVDLFESLTALRLQLESDGLMLCVNGARADVFPSGMSRQMAGGRKAYQLVGGRRPDRRDLVDIFDSACCDSVVSVDEQLASVRKLRER